MKGIILSAVLVISIVIPGWVMNLVKLANCDFEAPYKAEVIHAAGIVPPIGMITGWLDLGK